MLQKEVLSEGITPQFANQAGTQAKVHFVKHKKSSKMSGRMVIGFCKVLGAALCCIIPHPVARGAGVALIGSGVEDLTKDLTELDEENKRRQEIEGRPKPPPHFPPDFLD